MRTHLILYENMSFQKFPNKKACIRSEKHTKKQSFFGAWVQYLLDQLLDQLSDRGCRRGDRSHTRIVQFSESSVPKIDGEVRNDQIVKVTALKFKS